MDATFDYILDLDVSSPIRNKNIEEAFDIFKLDIEAQSLFLSILKKKPLLQHS